MKVCRFLRWKSFYGADFTTAREALDSACRNDVPFSCLKTCRPWGADSLPASPEQCDGTRACFEATAFEGAITS